MGKIAFAWFILKSLVCGCGPEQDMEKSRHHYKISKTGKLSAMVNESSGIARVKGKDSFWTHNDGGGGEVLFEIDATGNVLSTKALKNVKNVDWEDLAQAPDGTIYIGDAGNNSNARKDLSIYIIPDGAEGASGKISFSYGDQQLFPPPVSARKFDNEALFYRKEKLYLFSKNGIKTNHYVKLYEVPAQPGDYTLYPRDSVRIKAQVTGADISPDGRTFALLTYGKILLFEVTGNRIDFRHPKACIRLFRKQTEAILFLNNTDLMLTNEQGKVYRLVRR